MVSVIVLAHNHARYTRNCLNSIFDTRPHDFEIIIVDNGSTDETPQTLAQAQRAAKEKGLALRVLSPGANLGCATARNLAVEAAAGEEIIFLDNDTTFPDPAWIEKLHRALHTRPNAAIVGPKLCYPSDDQRIQCAGVGISRHGGVLFRGRGQPRDDPRFSRAEEVQCLISACWIFRRALYREIGGLDEIYNPIQFEDLDFCYRARSRGHKIWYTPDPVVHHWESITSTDTPTLNNRYTVIRNGLTFKKRWRHIFQSENGPADEETRWKFMDLPSLDGRRTR